MVLVLVPGDPLRARVDLPKAPVDPLQVLVDPLLVAIKKKSSAAAREAL